MARIDEAHCIGCTLCIQACPVDAIVGANKRMHTVLADWCTGCDLCVAPCPVDCIDMVPAGRGWTAEDADISRQRHRGHQARLARLAADNARLMAAEIPDAPAPRDTAAAEQDEDRKRSAIESALARARPPQRPAPMNAAKRREIFARLQAANPNPTTELEYDTPFQLLIAVLLSAQATDKSVNIATRKFFPEHGTPAAMLALGEEGLADYIKTIGLFRTKARTPSPPAASCSSSMAAKCRARARNSKRCPAWAARPPMWCSTPRSANTPWRWTRIYSACPTVPASRPEKRAGSRAQTREVRTGRIYAQRPSLADSAWPLCVRGAQTEMPAMRHFRPVRIQAENTRLITRRH